MRLCMVERYQSCLINDVEYMSLTLFAEQKLSADQHV